MITWKEKDFAVEGVKANLGIMEYCLKISEEAYEQEKERGKVINSKVDNLFKWLTVLISVFNISISILIKGGGINYKDNKFICLYFLQILFFVAAMFGIFLFNLPQKTKIYPMGSEVLKKCKEEPDKYVGDAAIVYQNILYKDVLTRRISDNNSRAVKIILFSNITLILSVICMAVMLQYIMLGIWYGIKYKREKHQ